MDDSGGAGGPVTTTVDGDSRSAAPRRRTAPSTVPEADVFRFDQVDLSRGRSAGAPVRAGMHLVFDERGVEVVGPEPHRQALLSWSEVRQVSFGEPTLADDGRTETPIDLTSRAGLVRYLVRSDRPLSVAMSALDVQVDRWRAPAGAAPARDGRSVATAGPPAVPAEVSPPPLRPRPVPSLPLPPEPPAGRSGPAPEGRPPRIRRTATLVVALGLLLSGIGLAVGLSLTSPAPTTSGPVNTQGPSSSADQRLAQRLMLTEADLPAGWRVAQGGGANANSPAVQRGETGITRSLAQCMGITQSQASMVLGGRAADQTAQASSPIFVAPTSSASAGSALELQSAATLVRSQGDERADFALLAGSRYPQCAATASAADLQLGVDQTSGGSEQAGPATVSPVTLPSSPGVRLNALLMSFTVKAGPATVPVEVESIWLGFHRVEANLQIFAIGGRVPDEVVLPSISTFVQRVASGGKSSVV